MNASLPWVFMRWLATHLVLLALIGFALAAIPVFGWVEVPALVRWDTGPTTRTDPLAPAAPPAAARQESERPRFKPVEEVSAPVLPPPSPPRAAAPSPTAVARAPGFRPPGLVPLTEQPAPTRDELVQQARRVFWNGEFEAAENAYMELLTRFPGDADLFGELGNLYRAMGKPEQARDAYYAAGVRLKAAGEREKLKVIRDLFEAEGDERVTELGN
jgi:hypothetical protein